MTNEEKQLLLADLCARLPHRVRGRVYAECSNGKYDMNGDMIFFDSPFDVTLDDINISTEELHVVAIGNEDTFDFIEDQQTLGEPYTVDEFKPYLRSMFSMTDEERYELRSIFNQDIDFDEIGIRILNRDCNSLSYLELQAIVNFFYAHHLDWCDLIPKKLALEAPEGMYNEQSMKYERE